MGTPYGTNKQKVWVFLRQIPKGSTVRDELGTFIGAGLRPSWMFFLPAPHTKIKRCEILQIFNPETSTTEYHGLVQIIPSKAALPLIERLNGSKLKGKSIEVRKFFRRSSLRDRRRTSSDRKESLENRRGDRRRDRLKSMVIRAPEVQRTLGIT